MILIFIPFSAAGIAPVNEAVEVYYTHFDLHLKSLIEKECNTVAKNAAITLPPKYYLAHFTYLLNFVQRQYADLLNAQERAFIDCFAKQSEDARCLFIRFANRRHNYFRLSKLNYPEIIAIEAAVEELRAASLVTQLSGSVQDAEIESVLNIFNKTELLGAFSDCKRHLSKPELVAAIINNHSVASILQCISALDTVVQMCCVDEVTMLKLLFFGSRYQDMEQFVIRDLGHSRFEEHDEESFERYFQDRQHAEAKLAIYLAYDEYRLLRDTIAEPQVLYDWFATWRDTQATPTLDTARQVDRLTLSVAAWLEKKGTLEQALAVYQTTSQPPSGERQVRLLYKLKQLSAAEQLCQKLLQQPANAEEALFAQDFQHRLQNKTMVRTTTQVLKTADVVTIDKAYQGHVEQGVLVHFAEQGYQGLFAENALWRSFFGLIFWDLLYDTQAGTIHQPLQRAPSDLFHSDFFAKREEALKENLKLLEDKVLCESVLQQRIVEKWGINNPLIVWQESLPALISICCSRISYTQLSQVMLKMATDLQQNGHGFPDLLIWNDHEYGFVEVKSPNDQLSAQQLFWLRFFGQIGISAQVLKVEWQSENI